jgi:SAM-dependent MidA family methyltransferase
MARALYDPGGFFVRSDSGPVDQFRTSVHASPLFAGALARLLVRVDAALAHPAPIDVVDVGAGRGELLIALLTAVPPELRGRIRATAVELAPRPADLPPGVAWQPEIPPDRTGLLIATEWLDNVPLEVVEVDEAGETRYVLVDGAGQERLGPAVEPADAAWLATWWPLDPAEPGTRAEIGAPRDAAWAGAVSRLVRGLAVAIDYGHERAGRPPFGTLTGYRAGRQVKPVPDGECDLTAHVAWDSVAEAGGSVARVPPNLLRQRDALRALGVHGDRPPLALAHREPAAYLRALAAASAAAELTDAAGLGAHHWLLQPVGMSVGHTFL